MPALLKCLESLRVLLVLDNCEHVIDAAAQLAERIFHELGGRPHWGKMNFLTAEDWKRAFPLLDRFVAVRRRMDPNGIFLNDWLRPILA